MVIMYYHFSTRKQYINTQKNLQFAIKSPRKNLQNYSRTPSKNLHKTFKMGSVFKVKLNNK